MTALLFSLSLFVAFALIGRGYLAAWRVNLGHTRNWLISPALGMSLFLLLTLALNQSGLPVASFARTLGFILVTLSLICISWRHCWKPISLGGFAVAVLVLYAVAGWPMLQYGHHWLSLGNDDMTNYCLGAERMLHNDFYRVPSVSELSGTDYSQYFWFMHVALLIRPGSEALLAGVSGLAGIRPVEAFMPLIFALAAVQLWALAALIFRRPSCRGYALLACCLLATSPLWNYGTLIQLIAQVGGIGLLLLTFALAARTRFPKSWEGRARHAAVISLPAAGLSVVYPEVIPFLVLSMVLFSVAQLVRERRLIPGQLATAGLVGFGLLIFLRHNVFSTAVTLLGQSSGGLTPGDLSKTIFPYFLVPSGFSFLTGLEALVTPYQGSLGAWSIAAGMGGMALLIVASLRHAWGGSPLSIMFLIMLGVGLALFFNENDFGIFKLAMFVTPLLVAEVARLLHAMPWRHPRTFLTATIFAVWIIVTQIYVSASIPGEKAASNSLAISDGSISFGNAPGGASLLSDLACMPVAKLAASLQIGAPLYYLSRNFLGPIAGEATTRMPAWAWSLTPLPTTPKHANQLMLTLKAPPFAPVVLFGSKTWIAPAPDAEPAALLTSKLELTSYNKLGRHFSSERQLFFQRPLTELKNHVVLIDAENAQHYYLGRPGFVGAYAQQLDYYAHTETMFGLGRRLVFQVLKPGQNIRVRLNLTCSLLGAGRTELPESAQLLTSAATPISLEIAGAGSANIYSSVMQPLALNGRFYFAFDFDTPVLLPTATAKSGLKALYNRSVSLDPRLIVGYCRDISIITDDDYRQMARPRSIQNFHHDIVSNPAFEYTGLYEDGWLSKKGRFVLGASQPGQAILIKGQLPALAIHGSIATFRLNSSTTTTLRLDPGDFTVRIPVEHASDQTLIEFAFDHELHLPHGDERPVAALLQSATIEPDHP